MKPPQPGRWQSNHSYIQQGFILIFFHHSIFFFGSMRLARIEPLRKRYVASHEPSGVYLTNYSSLFGIISQYDPKFDLKINIGHCDLYFMVQWFCVTSWRLFDVWTSYFGIKGQYDPTFDVKINVGLCDLYFMIQWFCLISTILFDAWVSYFQIMRQCDPNFDLKVNISQHDLYFMV